MRIQKISIALTIIGIFTIFIFTWKFMIQSDFTSMWLVGCGIGTCFVISAYLYSWMRFVDEKFQQQDKRLDSFIKWLSVKEMKE